MFSFDLLRGKLANEMAKLICNQLKMLGISQIMRIGRGHSSIVFDQKMRVTVGGKPIMFELYVD